MRFKVDENLPEELTQLLRESGWDCLSIVEQRPNALHRLGQDLVEGLAIQTEGLIDEGTFLQDRFAVVGRKEDPFQGTSYNLRMRIASGKVVSGQVVVEGEPLPEGALVTVLAREEDETFELDPAAEAELLESIAQADRGELIPAEEVLRKLRNQN